MHKLYELKEKLMKELEEFSGKGLSDSSLKTIDTLAHSIKNICKVIEACEEEEYSMAMSGYSRRGSYAGGSYDGDSYAEDGGSYVRPDGSYRDSSYARGRGSGAKRDSMGRYSRADDEMIMQLERLMRSADDEKTKKEIRKLIERI